MNDEERSKYYKPAKPTAASARTSRKKCSNTCRIMNHEIPITCPNCGQEYDAHLHWLVCPKCGHETKRKPFTDAFGLTDQEEDDILKLWEDGKKIGEIAIDLGLDVDRVIEYMRYQQIT